ncbi:MAG: hypothetical protein U1E97_08550 [Alphaproteobacteria bacterium]
MAGGSDDTDDDEAGGTYASPPCFMHELDPTYLGLPARPSHTDPSHTGPSHTGSSHTGSSRTAAGTAPAASQSSSQSSDQSSSQHDRAASATCACREGRNALDQPQARDDDNPAALKPR